MNLSRLFPAQNVQVEPSTQTAFEKRQGTQGRTVLMNQSVQTGKGDIRYDLSEQIYIPFHLAGITAN